MADIEKCSNQDCPSHLSCYRYTAAANRHWQAYGENKPEEGSSKCDNFWDNSDRQSSKPKKE